MFATIHFRIFIRPLSMSENVEIKIYKSLLKLFAADSKYRENTKLFYAFLSSI
jgi:hypothetical protein